MTGDDVIVGLPEGNLLRGVLYVYGLPLTSMLLGAVVAQSISPGDAWAVTGALVGLLLAGASIYGTSFSSLTGSRPRVIRRSTDVLILEDKK